MKKIMTSMVALALTIAAQAQTMNVEVGSVTYQFPAAQAGDMVYSDDGQTLTIMDKAFATADVSQIYIDNTEVADNTVSVVYNGTSATVKVAGNVAQYITPTVSGAHVGIVQGDVSDEVTYTLSGSSTDGEFYTEGSYKCTIELNGLTLGNQTPVYSGAAIYVKNGKRIDISVKKDTQNTLTDCASGDQKGCLWVKGHAELKGKGTLNIYGNAKHGIKTGEYLTMKNCTVNVLQAVGDGINASEYFLMESGELNIGGTGDDGLQADIDGTASTGETTDHEGEDSGNVYIVDGTVGISVTAAASKGIKASGDLLISGGNVSITTSGKYAYDDDDQEYKGCAGLKSDGNMTLSGGNITLKSTGYAGKCIKCDSILTVNAPAVIMATATGSSNTTYGSAKAIKAGKKTEVEGSRANGPGGGGGGGWPGGGGGGGWPGGHDEGNYTYSGGIVVNGGTITASASSHEAIESKNTIEVNDGYVYAYSSDDAINSASTFTINGGYVMGNSTGNDGLDANGNFNIKGGNVFAVAASQPEVGIDANTEGGYKLYITGGNVVAIGGLENGSSLSGVTNKSMSYTKGSWYTLKSGSTDVFSFKVPSNSRMGSSMVIVTAGTPTATKLSSAPSGSTIWDGFGIVN